MANLKKLSNEKQRFQNTFFDQYTGYLQFEQIIKKFCNLLEIKVIGVRIELCLFKRIFCLEKHDIF